MSSELLLQLMDHGIDDQRRTLSRSQLHTIQTHLVPKQSASSCCVPRHHSTLWPVATTIPDLRPKDPIKPPYIMLYALLNILLLRLSTPL